MNKTKLSRNLGMKYTRYLIYGNLFINRFCYLEENKFLVILSSSFDLVRTFVLLGLGTCMLPFAIALDFGQLLYNYQNLLARRIKTGSVIYNVRKTTLNLFNRSGRFAYLIIRKTDSIIHLKS
jgi:hypothetical protein